MSTTKPISWSFSKLSDFQRCKLSFKIKHIDRIPEPERPLPSGKTEHANDRGSRIHDNIETYIRGHHDALCPEADKHFGTHIDLLRVLHDEGMVEMEGEWGFDRDWEPAPWDAAWVRMKLDILIRVSDDEAIIGDWKTGRHFGNEVSHANQLNLYAVSTFLRHPELEFITVADYYIDHGVSTERQFTRDQALRFKRAFDSQGKAITDCTDWPANPNKFSCRWCPYGPDGTGHCTVGPRKSP
jgi:hypothetical protein